MSAVHLSSSARIDRVHRVWLDLLVGPVSLALVLLLSLLVPMRAQAQSAGVSPVLDGSLQGLVARIVLNRNQSMAAGSATSSGLQVLMGAQADIGIGQVTANSGVIGRVMLNEVRTVSMASIASRVVGIATPIALTMLAADLISYGIKQCATATTGWCGPQQNPNAGDTGFNGHQWRVADSKGTYYGDSPASACQTAITAYGNSSWTYSGVTQVSGTQYNCLINGGTVFSSAYSNTPCAANYVASGSSCVPDPNAPQVAYTYPQLSPQLAQALSGNPNRSKDYWGIMSPADWYAAVSDPSTSAQPAQIVNPANGQVAGPRTSSTSSAGTTTQQTNYTVSPNTDTGTLASNPVTLTTTTTTTNPDGTTTTTTTTTPVTGGGSQGGSSPQPQPASSPIPCGLGIGGSPKCQIDETGTPTKTDATTAMAQPATDLETAEQTAETQLKNVNNGISWPLHMPHILPGGTCQPIQWFSWGSWTGSWDVCTQLGYVRDLLAWLWPVLSAVYVWNKAAGANTVNG